MNKIKVWNSTKANLLVGEDKVLLRSSESMWVLPLGNVLDHIGSGALIKVDEMKDEPTPEPSSKKKKSDSSPVVEEPVAEKLTSPEDSILTEDGE